MPDEDHRSDDCYPHHQNVNGSQRRFRRPNWIGVKITLATRLMANGTATHQGALPRNACTNTKPKVTRMIGYNLAHPAGPGKSREHWKADHRRRMAEESVAGKKSSKPDSSRDMLPYNNGS